MHVDKECAMPACLQQEKAWDPVENNPKRISFNQAESFSVGFFHFPVCPGILKPNPSQLVSWFFAIQKETGLGDKGSPSRLCLSSEYGVPAPLQASTTEDLPEQQRSTKKGSSSRHNSEHKHRLVVPITAAGKHSLCVTCYA